MNTEDERTTPSVAEQLDALQVSAETRARIATIAEQLFRHVSRVVDLDRLFGLEQCLWSELDQLEIEDDEGDLAMAMLAEALHRLGRSSERNMATIPSGISEDEVIAAEYDEDCLMCRCEADDMKYRLSGRQTKDAEMHRFEAAAVKAWRAENAEALRRFGLTRDASGGTAKAVTS